MGSQPETGGNSPVKDPDSPAKDPDSPVKEDVSPLLSDPRLLEIAAPIRNSKRSSRPEMDQVILRVCGGQSVALKDLAALLNRKPNSLRDGHISRLLRSGQLELRYPDAPNHPEQAYRTADTL